MPLRLIFSIIFAFFATCTCAVAAEIGGSETFAPISPGVPPVLVDSPGDHTRWKLLNTEKRIAIVKHHIDNDVSREGKASEHVSMIFPKKTDIFYGHEIDFPCVIEELSPAVWVKSNQGGLVLGAQIVLPHAMNPNTGRPITFLVVGPKYTKVGDWQKLEFTNPNLCRSTLQTVRNLSRELEYKLDVTNMYVRQLILYVEGLPHPTNRPAEKHVWMNELQVHGCVPVWSMLGKESNDFGRLEPEGAAFWYELDLLEQQEYEKKMNESENSKNNADSQEDATAEGFPKAVSPVYQIHRIEIVGSTPPAGPAKTIEDHLRRGFRPKFDPINMCDFLTEAVSESVFPAHTTEHPTAKIVWESSTNIGRNLEDPYNIDLKTELNKKGGYRLDPTQSITLVSHNEPREQGPNYADVTETVIYNRNPTDESSTSQPIQTVRLEGQMIRLYDPVENTKTSLGIRAIEYRGEPLEFLYRMGFNTIWLSAPPSRELLEDAMRKQLWIICPPPPEIGIERSDVQGGSTYDRIAPTPREYQNVLCWNLGEYLVKPSVSEVDLRARKIRAADRNARQARPFICSIESGGLDFSSKISDLIVLMRRNPLLTSLDLTEYGKWLKDYEKKLQPSTPRWTAIQTQPDAGLVAQWDLFGGHREQPIVVSYDQIRLMVRQALAAGSHGILFSSQTPLTDENPETEYRAKALALANMELMLIDEWFAEGIVSATFESNHPQLSGFLLYLEKARLFLPLWNEPDSQYAMGQAAVKNAVFKIPIPETYDKLFLTPGVFEKVDSERVAGGTEFRINDASMNSLIFMTESGHFRGDIEWRAKRYGETMARWSLDLAKMRVDSDEKTFQMLKQAADSKMIAVWPKDNMPLVHIDDQETLLKMTRQDIELGENLFHSGDNSHAYLQAELATRGIRVAERQMWYDISRIDINRALTPVSTGFTSIPFYVSMFNNFRTAKQGQDLLLYGDFECSYANWSGAGWRHEQHQSEKDVTSSASLLSDNSRPGSQGNRVLQLWVQSEKNVQLETAPIWITTPGIPVGTGQLLCVSGWINIPQPLKGTADGLIIWDSIGGDPLALRFYHTDGWCPFAFFRYAPSDGLFETRFYLSGIGKAWIDDVSICPVDFGSISEIPLPQQVPTPGSRPWGWDRWNPRQLWRQQPPQPPQPQHQP